uniref:Uncharacterized protein n=1 Tax=Rhizophora mucronata TaxID=61149 RepID=A0A2P2K7B0_RHIMU
MCPFTLILFCVFPSSVSFCKHSCIFHEIQRIFCSLFVLFLLCSLSIPVPLFSSTVVL